MSEHKEETTCKFCGNLLSRDETKHNKHLFEVRPGIELIKKLSKNLPGDRFGHSHLHAYVWVCKLCLYNILTAEIKKMEESNAQQNTDF